METYTIGVLTNRIIVCIADLLLMYVYWRTLVYFPFVFSRVHPQLKEIIQSLVCELQTLQIGCASQ